jgi:hypothetical protein
MSKVHFGVPHTKIGDLDVARGNVAANAARGLPVLDIFSNSANANTGVIIFGGGPSLRQQSVLEALDAEMDSLKVLAGSAHRFLDQGLLKNGAHINVWNTPGAEDATDFLSVIQKPRDDVEYWVASVFDPRFLDRLEGRNVSLFHSHVPGVEYPEESDVIGGGIAVPGAALALLMLKGYRHFKLPGVDGGSFNTMPADYAYNVSDIATSEFREEVLVQVGRDVIRTHPNNWAQIEELQRLMDSELGRQCTFEFLSGTLTHMVLKRGMTAQVVYTPVPGMVPTGP